MSWTEYTYHRPQGTPKYPVQKVKSDKGYKMYVLTPEQEAVFRKLYPRTFNNRMSDLFGINSSMLHRIARDLGVKKNTKVIRHKQAMAAKKTCEKNGYYDSIRGKRPSEACFEAVRRKRAEGFCPLRQLKKKNPRKYRALMAKRSEQQKELWRKEEPRQRYGLTRHTKLRLRVTNRRMSGQKHVMIKKRNYFADPEDPTVVCYDSQTDRSEQMEATAQRHGLKVVEGGE